MIELNADIGEGYDDAGLMPYLSRVSIASGGHTSNVAFRRMFDPRLTEEYQVAGAPWSQQPGEGESLAMDIGASLLRGHPLGTPRIGAALAMRSVPHTLRACSRGRGA